mmetsp:Transcript_33323/g.60042  ORF Transcript_33323/g.60042 Transcript_33323/m.60042 type:complete len:176 (+) Transcript_33323:61-588(+)
MQPVLLLSLCFIIMAVSGIDTDSLGETKPCTCDTDGSKCDIDGYVGSTVLYEDDTVRVWNFTLAPGEMTSMHKHDHDYHFVAIKPTQLEVYGEDGYRLFDFRAEGVLGFKVNGDFLEPIGIELPWPVPRIHAAKNIGDDDYYEILYESKQGELSEEYLNAMKKTKTVQNEVGDEL